MKTTVDLNDFRAAFERMNRTENFSYEGLEVLFDYLEDLEQCCSDGETELDVIALCCDYAEDDFETLADQYGIDLSDCEDDDERIETVREYLNDNTSLCGEFEDDDGTTRFVFAQF